MANKTLYVSDADLPLWERAAKVAERNRQTLSALVHTALSAYIGSEFETLSVKHGKPFREERFEGRWLTTPDMNEDGADAADSIVSDRFAHYDGNPDSLPPESWRAWIGETAKGNIVVYLHHWNFDAGTDEVFEVHKDLGHARKRFYDDPRIPHPVWEDAASKLYVPTTHVRWLDI